MGTESYTPLDKLATLDEWADGRLYSIMLQIAEYPGMEAAAGPFKYIGFGFSPSQDQDLIATVYGSEKNALQSKPFSYMPKSGQIYGTLDAQITDNGVEETVPMFFIMSMAFMQNDNDSTDIERYLSSITLIDDPETAGVMGAEEEGGGGQPETEGI